MTKGFQLDRNCQNWGMREDAVRRGVPVSDLGTCKTYNLHNLPEGSEDSMTTPSSKEKVWSRWPNACVIESDIGGWFISLGLGDGRELAYRRDDDIEQLWNDAAANVNKFDQPASKLPALPTEAVPELDWSKVCICEEFANTMCPVCFPAPSLSVPSATEAAAGLPWEAMAGAIIDTVTLTAEDYVAETLIAQLKRYFIPRASPIADKFGDGDYSCATCGMGMEHPCEHWIKMLAEPASPIADTATRDAGECPNCGARGDDRCHDTEGQASFVPRHKSRPRLGDDTPLLWEYQGDGLVLYWRNPYNGGARETVAMMMWPCHAPEKTEEIEQLYERMATTFVCAWNGAPAAPSADISDSRKETR